MSSIAVKVSVAKLIVALQSKVKAYKAIVAAKEKAEKEYKIADKKWDDMLAKLVKGKTPKSVNVSHWRSDGVWNISVSYAIPITEVPPQPVEADVEGWHRDIPNRIEEMENAIRLLELSDADSVNASTYKSVAKYL